MKKNLLIFVVLGAVMIVGVTVYAAGTDDIVGSWLVEDGSGIIEIYKCKEKYCGRTVWIKPTPEYPDPSKKVDRFNPDPKKRNDKLLGKTILWGLAFDAEKSRWEDGSIYNTEDGKVYRCQITMETNNKLGLRGYIGFSLIGRTTVWTRSKK